MKRLLLGMLALLGCGGMAEAPPKIVIQIGHKTPVVATLWAEQGKVLFSLAQDGSIVAWDVVANRVLDQGQIEMPESAKLAAFMADGGGRTARISFSNAKTCPDIARASDGSCSFRLDLVSRVVTPFAYGPLPGATATWFPNSPDGRWRPTPNRGDGTQGLFDQSDDNKAFDSADCTAVDLCRYGVNLVPLNGQGAPIRLTGRPRSFFQDADLSPDGKRLALIESTRNHTDARINVLDLAEGAPTRPITPGNAYHRVQWADDQRLIVSSEGFQATNDMPQAADGIPPSIVMDPDCVRLGDPRACLKLAAHANLKPVPGTRNLVAAGSLADCFRTARRFENPEGVWCPSADDLSAPHRGRTLERFTPNPTRPNQGVWTPAVVPGLAGQSVTALMPTLTADQIVVATELVLRDRRRLGVHLVTSGPATSLQTVWNMDVPIVPADPEAGPRSPGYDIVEALTLAPDGHRVMFAFRGVATIIDLTGARAPQQFRSGSRRFVMAGDRAFGLDDGVLVDLNNANLAPLTGRRMIKGGFIPGKSVLWAATDDGLVQFWNSRDAKLLLSIYSLPDSRFFAVAPDGRYDTNLGPDTDQVRWLVADAPWQSFGAQTFMRDFYEPRLYAKLLDCATAGNCDQVLKPLPSLADLNRVLPSVRITGVTPSDKPGYADISFEVQEGVDPNAPNGKTRSGVYNPRLFLNNRFLGHDPDEPYEVTETIEAWRKLNKRESQDGVHRYTFTKPIPMQPGAETMTFSAYAFNSDRVKSDTATFTYVRPASVARPSRPRAFVLTIGINGYDEARLGLRFAANDARLVTSQLAAIPGYEMRAVTLAGDATGEGGGVRITRDVIMKALSILAGFDRDQQIAALSKLGVDASRLEASGPDDIVILSFAGHGWADKLGNFFLVPADAKWPDPGADPETDSLISTADLTMWLRAMSAADITFIIDACHSAASVSTTTFKPGPMGDAGLGQLAYDKGIRILAATQGDDVALEDSGIGHGLLTYALAAEGLALRDGRADLDRDGRLTIDEWLQFGAKRLPVLSTDVRVGKVTTSTEGQRGFAFSNRTAAAKAKPQEPSLFDFNSAPSKIVLQAGRITPAQTTTINRKTSE